MLLYVLGALVTLVFVFTPLRQIYRDEKINGYFINWRRTARYVLFALVVGGLAVVFWPFFWLIVLLYWLSGR